jgi:hypothetical protein
MCDLVPVSEERRAHIFAVRSEDKSGRELWIKEFENLARSTE